MVELKIKKDDEEITLVDKEDIEDALDEKADNSDLDDYIQKSSTTGLVKNDGSIDTTNYTTATGHNHDGTYIKTGTGTVTSTNIADKTIVNGDIALSTINSDRLEKSSIWWASTGYTKILQIKHTSNSTWANIPISFEIEKRNQNTAIQCHLMFTGASTSDPVLEEGNFRIDANANIYAYKESTGTWSIIVYAVNNDVQTIRNLRVGDYNYQTGGTLMEFTYLNETGVTLPTGTTTNPLIKATPLIADNLTTNDNTRALSAKQGKALKTLIDGKSPNVHTHKDEDILYNSSTQDKLTPLDMAFISNANKLAYLPASRINIWTSTDNGSTWNKSVGTNAQKINLVTTQTDGLAAGNGSTANYGQNQIRISLAFGDVNQNSTLYATVSKLLLRIGTHGALGTIVTVYTKKYNTSNYNNIGTFNVNGWTGWNAIPLSGTIGGYANQTDGSGDNIQEIILHFKQNSNSTGNLKVYEIKMIGERTHTAPSQLGKTGHLYDMNENQDAIFPAKIIKSGGTSSQFLKANGDVDSNTYVIEGDGRLTDTRNPRMNHIGSSSSAIKYLDNYTTAGFYYCKHDTNEAPYVENQPLTTNRKSFFLLVEAWDSVNYIKQTLTYYYTGDTYIRTKKGNNTSWTNWYKISFDGHNHDGTYLKTGTGTVTSTNIADKTIVAGDIADATITGGKLVDGTITNAKIGDSQVNNAKLSNNAVTTAKIVDKSVTNAKFNPVVYYGNGSGSTAGYIKMIKFVVGAAWSDKPITFDLYNRVRKDNIHVSLKFKNDSTTDPEIDFFSYTSYDSVNLYAYKESTSTWSIIIQKEASGNFEISNLIIPEYLRSTLSYANMNTQISALPSSTTANPLIQATQRTYGGTSNNNITAPAFIKSGGTSAQFLKANGSVETLNTTACTVTYTDGSTGTINLVTR